MLLGEAADKIVFSIFAILFWQLIIAPEETISLVVGVPRFKLGLQLAAHGRNQRWRIWPHLLLLRRIELFEDHRAAVSQLCAHLHFNFY